MMRYLIGTDEAGYGPNLGPLVIALTMWQVPDAMEGEDLYQQLPGIQAPGGRKISDPSRLLIGDSKLLYSSSTGLATLERGVLAAFNTTSIRRSLGATSTWRTLLAWCDSSCVEPLETIPWYIGFDRAIPLATTPQDAAAAESIWSQALGQAGIELLDVSARIVFPEQFNASIASCGSKGTALSLWTLQLVNQFVQSIGNATIVVQCDKHGGRNRYGALLQQIFPDDWIEVREESRTRSVYRWGPTSRRIEIRFVAQGERFLPSALASMTAKYLREIALLAFNAYWQQQVPGLRPTAGYPVDARRFRQEIEVRRRQLEISESVLWRQR